MTSTSRARHAALCQHYGPVYFDPNYRPAIRKAHQYCVGSQVYIRDTPGVYRRGTIIAARCWLGFEPAYSIRMAHGSVIHFQVPQQEVKTLSQVYGMAA